MDIHPDPRSSPFKPPQPPRPTVGERMKKWLVSLGIVGALLLKFKAALIPLFKFLPLILKTGGSMFLSVWMYSLLFGYKYALGFVLLILVHECGHLIAAKRIGLKVGWPVFIPFMGAFIALKEAPKNAWIESQVGIGGPLLGTVGAVACYAIYAFTGMPIFRALAHIGFLLNLFNLTPIGTLDGGRIVTALSPWLWIAGLVITAALLFLNFNFLLLLIFIISLPRIWSLFREKTPEEVNYFQVTPWQRALMSLLYFGLVAFLVVGMHFSDFHHPLRFHEQ